MLTQVWQMRWNLWDLFFGAHRFRDLGLSRHLHVLLLETVLCMTLFIVVLLGTSCGWWNWIEKAAKNDWRWWLFSGCYPINTYIYSSSDGGAIVRDLGMIKFAALSWTWSNLTLTRDRLPCMIPHLVTFCLQGFSNQHLAQLRQNEAFSVEREKEINQAILFS